MSDEQRENEEVEATKPADVVISTRFPAEVAERISAEARRRGMRTSQFVRVALESALEGGGASSGSIFVSMADAPVTFVAGSRHSSNTVGSDSVFHTAQ